MEANEQQPHLSSSGSIPIRAPLTLSSDEDDDNDFYYEQVCPKIAIYSDSNNTRFTSFTNRSNLGEFESGSEGFVSGGEDFEEALERPLAATQHEESMKVDESKCKDESFRHFVKHPDEETLEKIENVAKDEFFRPFVAHPDEETLGKIENVARDEFFRPFVAHPDEEVSQKSATFEKPRLDVNGSSSVEQFFGPSVVGWDEESAEENGNGVKDNLYGSFVENKDENKLEHRLEKDSGSDCNDYASAAEAVVLSGQNPNLNTMPIARLSTDSDEDEGTPFEAEDDDCVDTVRIPNFVMVQEMDVAAEIGVVGEEEREFNESLLGVHSSIVNNTSVFLGDGNVALGIGEKLLTKMDSMVNSVYAKVTQDDDQSSVENSPKDYCEVEEESSYHDIEEIRLEDMLESISVKVNVTDDCDTQICNVGKDSVPERAEIDFFEPNTALRKVAKQDVDYALEETMFHATNEHGITMFPAISEHGINDTDVSFDKDPIVGTAECGSGLPEADRFLKMNDELHSSSNILTADSSCKPQSKAEEGDEFDYNLVKAKVDEKSSPSKKEIETLEIDVSETDKQVILEGIAATSESVDCRFELPSSELTVTQSNEDIYREGKEMVDSNSCASTITSQENFEALSFEQHADSDSPFISSEPAVSSNPITSITLEDKAHTEYQDNSDGKEKEKLEKIQLLRVKFLRLIQRLGYSHENFVCKQVLYHLATALEGYCTQACNLESKKKIAMQLEADGGTIDFSLNILVLGKTGVGKSRTVNSIFGESKAAVSAFEPATSTVNEIVGAINGIKIRILDTPGLRISGMEQAVNGKILASIRKLAKRYPPDVVLYVDRLDSQSKESNDLPLLRAITSSLGSSIWQNVILTLTHAASASPDAPTGSPPDYEAFVTQRYYLIQHYITRASCDLHLMNPNSMCPLSLVENCPNGNNELKPGLFPDVQNWRSHLLLLCCSLKILAEATSISGTEDLFDHWKLFGSSTHCSPPVPYLLSLLLQSHPHWKVVCSDHSDNESTVGWEDVSDSDQEYKYDQLPLFKPLMRSDVAKISKDQRKESKRLKWVKVEKYGGARAEDETAANTTFPLHDINLPLPFDKDDLVCRYQCVEASSEILMKPKLDTYNGWDHDCGYDNVNIENNLPIGDWLPSEFATQITEDKKEFNIHLDPSVSAKHGDSISGPSRININIHPLVRQPAYSLKAETKVKNFKINTRDISKSVTFIDDVVIAGWKVGNQIRLGRCAIFSSSAGAACSRSNTGDGANFKVHIMEKDFSIGQDQCTVGFSLVRYSGETDFTANLESLVSIGRNSKLGFDVGLNNKHNGKITVRTSSSEHLHIGLLGILPLAFSVFRTFFTQF